MKKLLLIIGIISTLIIAGCNSTAEKAGNESAKTSGKENVQKTNKEKTKVDHSDFIKGELKTGPEVTAQCLECHNKQADHVLDSGHWKWEGTAKDVIGHEADLAGKATGINSFCIAVTSNEARCTSCHVGYGWDGKSEFDFTDKSKIDCLVCHDTTGTYKKDPPGAGMPMEDVNLLEVAQNVGLPNRANCGACHFNGGGGDGVKSPGMDSSLTNPTPEQDVHMGGQDMNCQSCHTTTDHEINGGSVHIVPTYGDRVSCENCHNAEPHKKQELNNHVDTIACQTCHIPTFNTVNPTKMFWDWSTAGQDKEAPKDQYGKESYMKIKGDFIWEKNVKPAYAWYNGKAERYFVGDQYNKNGITNLAKPAGDINDPKAKIYPFKLFKGKQIADPVNGYLLTPQLFGGYWKHFDWDKAARDGAAKVGMDYSGKFEFVETEMYMAVNHEVVPKEQALTCNDCHTSNGAIDFKALGYEGDPMEVGGRSK